MRNLFEITGLNVYLQIAVTIISIAVHLLSTRNKERQESTVEIIAIYTISSTLTRSLPGSAGP